MNLTLGFSPCPNDCFIFYALVHGKIDTGDLKFEPVLEDVETLNRYAFESKLDISKLSFNAYGHVTRKYLLLNSGAALGFNCGPLLVSKRLITDPKAELRKVAIPGKYTTANFLLSLALPHISEKIEYVFSDIEDAVLNGEVDAGLLIHENRFTYEARGLKKVMDLGEYWESLIHAPIPLGGIAIRRNAEDRLVHTVDRLIRESVQYAFKNPDETLPYVREHAQAMSDDVMRKHIDLYVNEYSVDLGVTGRNAVDLFFGEGKKAGVFGDLANPLIAP
jgi:1,4-dihydroxy-6-naphthoate synthase